MTEACHLHQLRECCLTERPEEASLTGSAVFGLDQADRIAYFTSLANEAEIWDGTGTNIKPCRPIPYGADE